MSDQSGRPADDGEPADMPAPPSGKAEDGSDRRPVRLIFPSGATGKEVAAAVFRLHEQHRLRPGQPPA